MRAWASGVYGLPPYRVIGSAGRTEFRVGDAGPELIKSAAIQVIDDGPGKPSSIHQHIGQRPVLAAGNTDGDLAMLQWTAASPAGPCNWSSATPTLSGNTPTTRPGPGQRRRPDPHRRRRWQQLDRRRYGHRLVHRPLAGSSLTAETQHRS
jgi:hypothetical protein